MANEKRLIDAFESICKKCNHYLVCKYADNETAECNHYKAFTVDAVEVVHARWERYIDKDEDVHYYTCSACNYMAIPRYKYCPNCGAEMVGADNV